MSGFYELIKNDKTIINIYNKIHKYEDEEKGPKGGTHIFSRWSACGNVSK